jgi:hypothetical protein
MPAYFQGAERWGNLEHPNVYVADSQPQYPEGTVYIEGKRKFVYTKYVGKSTASTWIHTSIAATNGDDLMGKFLMNTGFPVTYASTYTYGLTGTKIIEVDTTTLAIEKFTDFYSGGWVSGKDTAPSDARFFFRRIKAADYSAAKTVGGSAKTLVNTLTVDQNLVNTFTAMALSLTPNQWKHATWLAGDANAMYTSPLGACMVNNPTANYWCWVQTYGETGLLQITNTMEGANERETLYYCYADGSVQPAVAGATNVGGYPEIGRSIPNAISETGSGQDDNYPIVFLTLMK